MRALYDSKSKLDDRGIKALLSETEKYRTWLKVEAALALAQAEEGFIPREAARDIASVRFEDLDLAEMERIKARGTRLRALCEGAGECLPRGGR